MVVTGSEIVNEEFWSCCTEMIRQSIESSNINLKEILIALSFFILSPPPLCQPIALHSPLLDFHLPDQDSRLTCIILYRKLGQSTWSWSTFTVRLGTCLWVTSDFIIRTSSQKNLRNE